VTRGLLLALAVLALPPAARAADIFSPGELSKPHASLEGISNCTKCHPQGQQLSQGACLACHEELKGRLSESRGFHGHLKGKERDCWACHHEHQGRDFPMLDWATAGRGGEKGFDHARTGEPLKGKHAGIDCQKCHDRKIIVEPGIKALLEKAPTRKTFLGAPAMAACSTCHFDEHRGQVGGECRKCHTEQQWKPPQGFDHAKTSYPLLGKHQRVACDKCHPKSEDVVEHVGLQPKNRTFLKMKPLPHESCLDCHKDPHQGRFGETCTKCHTEVDWKTIVTGSTESRSFHDRTKFKLEGAHASTKCVACHGPFPGEKAVFKGLAFERCIDCHVDAHAGQLRHRGSAEGLKCERCHSVQTFESPRYGPEEHQSSRYPLEGAHRTVPCSSCHQSDPKIADRFPRAAREELQRRSRPVRVSLAVLAVGGDLTRCETCHADPHGGQFDKRAGQKGCVACHELSSFTKTRFDHDKDTKFPLEGKHAKAACASCHPSQAGARGVAQVKYKGIETTCAGCHADPHAAQFARAPREPTDCARCHTAADWKKELRFKHEAPFTNWKITGKHLKVECRACHVEVKLAAASEWKLYRYKGTPRECQGCHVDFHKGAFKGFEP
jgi:hypothetical protein